MRPDSNINNNARKLDRPRRLDLPGLECFEGCTRDPRLCSCLNSNSLSRNFIVSFINDTSFDRVNRLKWYDRSLERRIPSSVQSFSFSLEDNKKIRWNYLISGQATNEIKAQSWSVEFQLQLWNTMVRLESINPSISDNVISNFLSIDGEEHRASMRRLAPRCRKSSSYRKSEGHPCPDNWTGAKGVGWLNVGKGISNFDMLNM